MSGEDGEVSWNEAQLVVLRLPEDDPFVAVRRSALAEDRELVAEVERLGELVDALVDLTEERLVPPDLSCLPSGTCWCVIEPSVSEPSW